MKIIGRTMELFNLDISENKMAIDLSLKNSKILVLGAAGTIGQAITVELFKRDPKVLHAVDISENNLVELVRSIRSSHGYSMGEFKTYCLDIGSREFDCFMSAFAPYDYIFNLSALKHVRSEEDPYTLMRMLRSNIFNAINVLKLNRDGNLKKYFCVSTDKATNPVNMMGASKRIMEQYLMRESANSQISLARFANVAFSDGSLLHGFNQRFLTRTPISAPIDVQRYFITPKESGQLCLLASVLGENRDIYFPKLDTDLAPQNFSDIACRFLNEMGYDPFLCESEEEARQRANELISNKKWPVIFFKSDTTGEKPIEEFYADDQHVLFSRYHNIGVIKHEPDYNDEQLVSFSDCIERKLTNGKWDKHDLVVLFQSLVPEFNHIDTGKYLDGRM